MELLSIILCFIYKYHKSIHPWGSLRVKHIYLPTLWIWAWPCDLLWLWHTRSWKYARAVRLLLVCSHCQEKSTLGVACWPQKIETHKEHAWSRPEAGSQAHLSHLRSSESSIQVADVWRGTNGCYSKSPNFGEVWNITVAMLTNERSHGKAISRGLARLIHIFRNYFACYVENGLQRQG